MWISRKRWEALEKRVADLEEKEQKRDELLFPPTLVTDDFFKSYRDCISRGGISKQKR